MAKELSKIFSRTAGTHTSRNHAPRGLTTYYLWRLVLTYLMPTGDSVPYQYVLSMSPFPVNGRNLRVPPGVR